MLKSIIQHIITFILLLMIGYTVAVNSKFRNLTDLDENTCLIMGVAIMTVVTVYYFNFFTRMTPKTLFTHSNLNSYDEDLIERIDETSKDDDNFPEERQMAGFLIVIELARQLNICTEMKLDREEKYHGEQISKIVYDGDQSVILMDSGDKMICTMNMETDYSNYDLQLLVRLFHDAYNNKYKYKKYGA